MQAWCLHLPWPRALLPADHAAPGNSASSAGSGPGQGVRAAVRPVASSGAWGTDVHTHRHRPEYVCMPHTCTGLRVHRDMWVCTQCACMCVHSEHTRVHACTPKPTSASSAPSHRLLVWRLTRPRDWTPQRPLAPSDSAPWAVRPCVSDWASQGLSPLPGGWQPCYVLPALPLRLSHHCGPDAGLTGKGLYGRGGCGPGRGHCPPGAVCTQQPAAKPATPRLR